MVEISKYGSGEGSGGAIPRTYSTGNDVRQPRSVKTFDRSRIIRAPIHRAVNQRRERELPLYFPKSSSDVVGSAPGNRESQLNPPDRSPRPTRLRR